VRSCCEKLAKKYVLQVVEEDAAIAMATATEEEEGKEAELKAEVEEGLAAGGVPAPLKARLLRKLLVAKRCRNQGYLLAASPNAYGDALHLFLEPSKDPETPLSAADDPVGWVVDEAVRPSHVVLFKSEDDAWLKQEHLAWWERERAKKQQQQQQSGDSGEAGGGGDEEADAEAQFAKLLASFRESNKDDDEKTPIVFFEKVCGLETLNVAAQDPECQDAVVNYVNGGAGPPCNFHPTKEEIAAEERIRRFKEEQVAASAVQEAAERKAKEEEEKRAKEAARATREEEVRKAETEMLESRSLPLRQYLMANVIPTLTEGMLEVVKMKPEDPIDYLVSR
jgi:adenylate kinase